MKLFFFIFSVSFGLFLLSGCQQTHPRIAPSPPGRDTSVAIEEFLAQQTADSRIVALYLDALALYDPALQLTTRLKTIEPELFPIRNRLDTWLTSPTGSYVLWYSPGSGIVALRTLDQQIEVIHQPSEWFQANPYLSLSQDGKTVYFIDGEGRTFNRLTIESRELTTHTIPYPYGTQFRLSPDEAYVLFIPGFGQAESRPEYLITKADGTEPVLLSTDAELADKEMIAWSADNARVLTVEQGTQIIGYPRNDVRRKEIFADLSEETGRLVALERIENIVYVKAQEGDWFAFEGKSGSMLARIPFEIASNLNRPEILPWNTDLVLLRETLTEGDETFKRLWASDWRGAKKVLVPEYGRARTTLAE